MIVELIGAVILLPLLLGMGTLTLINRKEVHEKPHMGEAYVCGFVCLIGVFAVGHLGAVFGGWSITFCGKVILALLCGMTVLSIAAVVLICREKRAVIDRSAKNRENYAPIILPAVVFGVLLGIMVWRIVTASGLQIPGDITLETVNSFLVTDRIYEVSPLTGKGYAGPPLRYKILCLPTMYTLLCRWFQLAPEVLVNRVIPLMVMGTAFLAYDRLAAVLFGSGKETFEKRMWFLVMVAAIFLLYEGTVAAEGYGILYGGHLGTTWRNSILLPLAISGSLTKKWWQAGLCILAEVCIVWTFWGMGFCLVVTAVLFGFSLIRSRLEKKSRSSSKSDKEGGCL